MAEFRFENLEIWQRACDQAAELCVIADRLSDQNLYAFSDQLRRAALSISNNIAEGSGSTSNKDFANFLNYARRSVFECASMTLFFRRRELITDQESEQLLPSLSQLSRQITAFARSLR